MQLAKSIVLKRRMKLKTFLTVLSLGTAGIVSAQSNSPYSRYGLGDLVPQNNLITRSMGGITAGYAGTNAEPFPTINFANPASYSAFQVLRSPRTNKMEAGRIILDAGINFERRTLIAPNTVSRFTSPDAYFSYLQVGIPLKHKWGLTFGLRPISRISYKINRAERLIDPMTNQPIDSALTQFNGSGGSFLPSVGTGFGIGDLSVGINVGYLFGKREITTNRALFNDTVSYYASDHTNTYNFGSLFYNLGLQYKISLKNSRYLRLGVAGNLKQTISGTRDQLRQTYVQSATGETLQIDSVFQEKDVKGEFTYPTSYTAGFVLGSENRDWLFGVDYSAGKWSEYNFFGTADSVQDNWKLSAGGQYRPKPSRGYFSNVTYRAGFSYGQDYISIGNGLPTFGASFGLSLPVRLSRQVPNQRNAINLAFEFMKRGDNESRLKENAFRFSLGFNFTDLWFLKRKYD